MLNKLHGGITVALRPYFILRLIKFDAAKKDKNHVKHTGSKLTGIRKLVAEQG
jgi:hypothetical protein